MAASIARRSGNTGQRKRGESGFSLIEVVISMAILTVGMVSLLGVFGLAMASTQTSEQDMIAKQLANEAYESVVTARNTSQMNWDEINNVGTGSPFCISSAPPCGIFLTGFLPMYNAGADGIFGTADDAASGEEQLQDPGPDGVFQTSDDTFIPLTGYQRKIVIGPLYTSGGTLITSLKSVTITVEYTTSQMKVQKNYTVNSFISQFQ
jgi:prepilin-type N-terminal cleavage/methylation domain-containing protein